MNSEPKSRKATLKYISTETFPKNFKEWILSPTDKFGYDLNYQVGEQTFLKVYFGSYTFFLPIHLFLSLELDL